MTHPFFAPPRPRLFAHRGASGLFPENTMAAFQHAVDAGITYVETDVHGTADGHVVIHHDPTLDRTTNGTGEVKAHTLAQLQNLDAGYRFTPDDGATWPHRDRGIRIPTLQEALEAFPGVRFNMEVKQADPPLFETVIALVRDMGRADDVLLACEGDVVRDQLDSVAHDMPRNHAGSEVLEFIQAVATGALADYTPPAHAFQIPESYQGFPVLTPDFLDAAHVVGVEVHVWTVNDEADMRRFLDMGVDGVMSDFPSTLVRVANDLPA